MGIEAPEPRRHHAQIPDHPTRYGPFGTTHLAAVIPEITGRAWVTGTAQYQLDPTDPFPACFDF